MPITVTTPGPDGTLQTVPDPAAPPPEAPVGDSAPPGDVPAAPAPAEVAPPASAPDVPRAPATTEEDEEELPGLSRGVQRRIDRLTRQREDARRESAAIKARLEMLEQGYRREPQAPEPVPVHQQPEPREEDYPSQQEWFSAVRAWDKAQLKQELALEQHARAQQTRRDQQAAQRAEQAAAARQKHADFDQVMDRLQGLYTSPALDACVHESDLGAELAYYLAQHPDEITRLNTVAQERPLAMAREIGKLEVRLSAPASASNGSTPPREPPSPLPPPVQPVAGAGQPGPAEPNFDTMSQREFEAWWKRQYPGVR